MAHFGRQCSFRSVLPKRAIFGRCCVSARLFFHSFAVALFVICSALVGACDLQAQNYLTPQEKEDWIKRRSLIRASRKDEIGTRSENLRHLESAARVFADQLSTIDCSTKEIDKWWDKLSRLNGLMAKTVEQNIANVETIRRVAQAFPYNETFTSALNDDVSYASDYNRYLAQYMQGQVAARLTFADGALQAGCIDLADAEYRKVLKLGDAKFTSRAMVGIQDVREARARLIGAGTTAPSAEICSDGKPRHWSQSAESCHSR